jgi:hypothetical protein
VRDATLDRVAGLEGGWGQADEFLASLDRWAALDRAGRAASARARGRALVEQSAGQATWTGLLVDLAERGEPVVLSAGGSSLSGRVLGVGRDMVVLERPGGGRGLERPVLVALGAIEWVRPDPAGRPPVRPGGSRRGAIEVGLGTVLDGLAGEQAPVCVRSAGGETVGTVSACGSDFFTVKTPGGQVTYVRMAGVVWVELR